MTFALYELSKNRDAQDRLRNEIRDALKETEGVLTYEMIQNMQYLNAVIAEALRLYPSIPILERLCVVPPGETYSLEPFIKFAIPRRMPIYISNYGLQRDPQYFPDPENFNPDRFLGVNKSNVNPYTYLPFGNGPHNCIGERMGLLQTSVGIVNYLRNHRIEMSPRTSMKLAYIYIAFTLQSTDGIYVKLIRDPLV